MPIALPCALIVVFEKSGKRIQRQRVRQSDVRVRRAGIGEAWPQTDTSSERPSGPVHATIGGCRHSWGGEA